MSKNIKVTDEVYEQLKTEADKNFRTLGGQIQSLLNGVPEYTVSVKSEPPAPELKGYPCCRKATPCKHWDFDGEKWVNPLTGEIKEL